MGGLAQVVQPDQAVGVWAGYKSMVDEVGKGRRSLLSGEFRCGGLGRYIGTQPGFSGISHLSKVKAHQHLDSLGEGEGRRLATGNSMADEAAKAAMGRHPAHPAEQTLTLEGTVRDALAVLRVACAVLPLWPRLRKSAGAGPEESGSGLGKLERKERPTVFVGSLFLEHQWCWELGQRRCLRCLATRSGG